MPQTHDEQPPPSTRPAPSLTTLPHEIQQKIYHHVYPVSDITLLPSTHPAFVPPNLTRRFNYTGHTPTSLLQTSSAVCAIAQPIRAASFSGTLNASDASHLMSASVWIHDHVRVVRLLLTDAMRLPQLRLELFPRLRRLEVTLVAGCFRQDGPGASWHDMMAAVPDVPVRSGVGFVDPAHFQADRHTGIRRDREVLFARMPPGVEIVLRRRYWSDCRTADGTRLEYVVGVVLSVVRERVRVLTKVVRTKDQVAILRRDEGSVDELSDAISNMDLARDRKGNTGSSIQVLPAHQLPREFSWVKCNGEWICWDDLLGND